MSNTKNKSANSWGKANNIPLNCMDDVTKDWHLPEKVLLHDTTLRDGEQFAGVEFTKAEKLQIGKALSDYGVHRIEIMPAVSRDDFETTAELNTMGLTAEIVGFCRSVQSDIDSAIETGCKSIVMEIVSSPGVLKAMGWSLHEAADKMINMSHYAKEKDLRVTGFFVAVTDGPMDHIEMFIRKVLAEGSLDAICIPDTMSKCLPQTIYHLVRELKKWTDKPIEIHPHNAFNMGTANALSGVMAGAEVVHTCINSLGEAAGNAPLDAVAVNLNLMLGLDTGVKFEQTYALSRLVEKASRVPLQANWPLSGDRVFTTEAGISVDIYAKMAKAGVTIPQEYDLAANIGRTRKTVVGKLSGRTSIIMKAKMLGLPELDKEKIPQILELVKQQSIEKHDTLSDDEFKAIVFTV